MLELSEKRKYQLNKCLKIQLQGIFEIIDWKGRAQPIVDAGIPGLNVLDDPLRKQAEKQHPSKASLSAPASMLLSCLSSCPGFLH